MSFDPRMTPARADLAAAHLKGKVNAPRYAEGQKLTVSAPILDVTGAPERSSGLTSQLLMGEVFTAYEQSAETGLAWGQAERDGYVGYVSLAGLDGDVPAADAQVIVRSTHIYPEPNIKTRPLESLPFLARVSRKQEENGFFEIEGGGYCAKTHLSNIGPVGPDFVSFAEGFQGTPYLWGGRSGDGIDCSGLIQLSLAATGRDAPRDSDMQETQLGEIANQPFERGDLVFWKGHVGVMQSAELLLHANSYFMQVTSEPLKGAKERIALTDGPITAIKRLTNP